MKYKGEIENLTSMYDEKIEILEEVLRMTKATSFSDTSEETDADVDTYVLLMEQREKHIEKMKEIDKRIEAPIYLGNEELVKVAKPLIDSKTEAMQTIVSEIIKQDKEHKKYADTLITDVRHHIKEINKGKNVSHAYGDHQQVHGSTYFDHQG